MPPPMQRFAGAPNNLAHYQQQQYPSHSQGLPPPSLASNPGFMNANSMNNPFSVNGNALSLSGGFGGAGLGMPGATGLASQAAQLGFASANMHQGHNGMSSDAGSRGGQGSRNRIRDVWASNLEEEMILLRCLADKFPYISMDTEFPGVVARPMGSFNGKADYHYQCLRCNVDLLKTIQLGISLFSEEGNLLPPEISAEELGIPTNEPLFRKFAGQMIPLPTTWQFNFDFSLEKDMYAEASIESLKMAQLDFRKLETDGIDPFAFGSALISSGLVCDEDIHWISFHGGYDFGYLTKLLNVLPLPDDETTFKATMSKFFPSVWDIKYLVKWASRESQVNLQNNSVSPDTSVTEIFQKFDQKASLDNLAESLKVKRQGLAHQAGSDSLLTGKAFFRIRDKLFGGVIGEEHNGLVWGLSTPEYTALLQSNLHSTPQHHYSHNQENVTPGQNGYANGGPSTPNTGSAGLASTPGHNSNGGLAPITPGGMGGVFGNFQYNGK
ncbi:CAF1-domain-containing protein [Mollisia scopiformis]|uniref:poly(A)-specific ribonuclease n=1 Tax=Mollisia scopiformis TaxID=149040 RepID=A0A194WY29_MOLSC|nr:CAF1-domain-containing protein [Mollisia scopiformis]KUJ12835.1 CAF1-domain-containing protein [Mollisia scopiformis]